MEPAPRLPTRIYAGLGHLGPALALAAALFALFTIFRCALTATFITRVSATPGWPWLFAVGWRMDSVLICQVLSLPVLMLLVPRPAWSWLKRPAQVYAVIILIAALFFELSTFRFMEEFDRRPDRLFWEYLTRPQEVARTVIAEAWPYLLVMLVVAPILAWWLWKLAGRLFSAARPWPWWIQYPLFPLIGGLLFLGMRGTLGHRPVNPSSAAFSNENLLNQLALNAPYSALYALYALGREAESSTAYGKLPKPDIISEVRRASLLPAAAFLSDEIPTLRTHRNEAPEATRPRNVVILLEESLGAQFTGCVGGQPLTPELDRLAKDGLLLTRLFATGTRTVRGIEAVACGFPPTPARSVVKLGLSQSGFFTIADLLGRHGYRTFFFYGGESHFDDMRGFFQGNGFTTIIDEPLFVAPAFQGIWGVSDEDLVRRTVQDLAALPRDQPFCALMLSTSNHVPFEFPDGRIELADEKKQTQRNAIKYADFAIGEFFRLAREQPFYADTLFLVVGDHNIRTVGQSLVPVHGFHIPAVLIGPDIPAGITYAKPCSQLDLLPTLLARIGLEVESPLIGHDLLALPADFPGRSIMQFAENHGYLVGDRLVVHVPHKPAKRFRLHADWQLEAVAEPWPELEREALAHALLPSLLYQERRYRLPAVEP